MEAKNPAESGRDVRLIHIELKRDLITKLDELAASQDVPTRAAVVRAACREYVAKQQKSSARRTR